MKTSGMATKAMLALLGFASSCNFDSAFKRYCDNNPRCQADAGPTLEVGQGSEVKDAELPPSIPSPKNCASPNDCSAPDEFCHPLSQVCMKTCNAPTDCPPWLGGCSDPRGGPLRGQKVCSCTAQSCNNFATLFTCNPSDGLCERICGTDQDCSGFQPARTCDQQRGWCLPIPQTCAGSADCLSAAQPRCDFVSLLCAGCASSADCAGRPDGLSQCTPAGNCVGPQPGN